MTPRPLPEPTPLSEGFWAAAREGRLVVQRCHDCGTHRHYPQDRCPACTSAAWSWSPIEGRGVIYSFTITHQAFHPAWTERVPYAVATIELEHGIRVVSDLDAGPEPVHIGAPVEVFFDEVADGVTLPRFRLCPPDEEHHEP